ncbi:MAG: cation-translocating P-type ATPase [Gemmatimonadota bacterium]
MTAERTSVAPPPWHEMSPGETLDRLGVSNEGLTSSEAERRLDEHGPNALVVREGVPAWKILLDQFKSLVVGLLVAVAVLALVLGDLLEAGAIGIVLLLNVAIGFFTEWRARRVMEGLAKLQVQEGVAIRDGEEVQVDARTLVPGDVVALGEGDAVPADARLLESSELQVNEASLTGESVPVRKKVEALRDEDASLADRLSMVYKGTMVVGGSGRAVVTATGLQTEIGRVSELVQEIEDQPAPIELRLAVLGRRLIWVTLGLVAVVALLGIVRGNPVLLTIETAIALGIAAVPEGLPVVATVTLAAGMRRMARRAALVRRLPAVEALGSATVVCSDKTGTLTTGRMTLTRVEVQGTSVEITGAGLTPDGEFEVENAPVDPADHPGLMLALRTGVLASRASLREGEEGLEGTGDPIEVALLVGALKAGLDPVELRQDDPPVDELPFSSQRKLLASFHDRDGGRRVYVKGAPERLLELSSSVLDYAGESSPLDAEGREALEERNESMAASGLRVLALAYADLAADAPASEESLEGLTFVALVGMEDPPAEGVERTVAVLGEAGVRTVMITGDQAPTARAVAEELGIHEAGSRVVDGPALAGLDREGLARELEGTNVFCRVTPEEKVRIVEGLQARGELVAMLGDGVNDAPALKRAEIGVAMGGRGTDVARETADLVLQDDRFGTIGTAVEEGRIIFDNIRKFIFYLFSCNVSEIGVLFAATAAGMPLPLLPLQLLWLNFITDVFPALALAAEPAEPDVMRRPPRDPDAAILSRGFVALIGGYALALTAVTFGIFVWSHFETDISPERAVTLTFMTLALGQLFHAFNARTIGPLVGIRRIAQNRWMWGAVVLTIGLQVAAVTHPSLRRVLGTVPLDPGEWALVAGAGAIPLVLGQAWKLVRHGSGKAA